MSVGKATNRIAATQCSGHEEIMATQAQFNNEQQTSGLGNIKTRVTKQQTMLCKKNL